MLFSQEAVAALLLQLSLPLALRDERLHLRAQSDHILLCHRKQREEGISENPTEWIQVRRGHHVYQLPSPLAVLEQQRGDRAECQGLSPHFLRLPK